MRNPLRLALVACLMAGIANAEWPQFRGPTGNGVSKHSHLLEWSEQQHVRWKVKVEGIAWSQPIVFGERVFLTTAVADGQASPKSGESGPGFNPFSFKGLAALSGGSAPDIACHWKLLCLNLPDGSRLWEQEIHKGKPAVPIHRSNSYASDSPVCDGQRVFVQVPMIGVYCFDLQGKRVWEQPLAARKMQYGWGTGSSLTASGPQLFLQCDNEEQSFLAAYDKASGKPQWKVDRAEGSNWSTPYVWANQRQTELVVCGGRTVQSYDFSGKLLWELPAEGRSATTAVGNQDLLVVGSVTRSRGGSGALTAVRAGASGVLTDQSEHIAWTIPKAAPELASPLLVGDYLYVARQHGGIIACYDAKSGEQHFRQRLPKAGGFTASPWSAGGHAFFLDENGKTFAIKPADELQLIATNSLDGMFWSSAAVVKGGLLLRSVEHLYCIAK